jgi:hypothetical protein
MQMPLKYFFYARIDFWSLECRGANENYEYFLTDYLGGLKTKTNKNLHFMGRRIEACEPSSYKGKEAQ